MRALAVGLQALAVAGLLLVAWARVRSDAEGQPLAPAQLLLWLLLYGVLPGGLAAFVRLGARAALEVHADRLVLRRRGDLLELPLAALAGVRPWRVPLPGPGLSLRLASGRPFPYGVQAEDPLPLLEALGRVSPAAVGGAPEHPTTRFAHARSAQSARGAWRRRALRYGLFPLLPTAVLFRLHQHIAFGGTLGEYHLHGLAAYLRTLLGTWLDVTAHLLLWAALWRLGVEALSLASAWALAPARAPLGRRVGEGLFRLAYYGGVPAALAFLLLRS
jgi:hypothetical protein